MHIEFHCMKICRLTVVETSGSWREDLMRMYRVIWNKSCLYCCNTSHCTVTIQKYSNPTSNPKYCLYQASFLDREVTWHPITDLMLFLTENIDSTFYKILKWFSCSSLAGPDCRLWSTDKNFMAKGNWAIIFYGFPKLLIWFL